MARSGDDPPRNVVAADVTDGPGCLVLKLRRRFRDEEGVWP